MAPPPAAHSTAPATQQPPPPPPPSHPRPEPRPEPPDLPLHLVLRIALLAQDKKQMELSWDTRMSVTRLSEIMNRRDRPVTPREQNRIALALGIPAQVLFPGDAPRDIRRSLAAVLGITAEDLATEADPADGAPGA